MAGCSFTTILPSAKERRDIIKPELLSRPDFRALIAFIKSRERTWDKEHPAAVSGSGGVKFNVSVFVNSQTFNRFPGQKAQRGASTAAPPTKTFYVTHTTGAEIPLWAAWGHYFIQMTDI